MDTIKSFERSWITERRKEKLFQTIFDATKPSELVKVLITMEEGFSWPILAEEQARLDEMDEQLAKNPDYDVDMKPILDHRKGLVRRFWTSDEAQEEWKNYVSFIQEDDYCKLYLAVIIFIQQSETYIEKLQQKRAKELKKQGKTDKSESENKASEGRRKRKGFYREKSESDSDVSMEEAKGKSSRTKRAMK